MQNKKLKYVLIPLVIVLWAMIFYKIYSYVTGTPDIISVRTKGITEQAVSTNSDTFTIAANYRDPFLGNLSAFENSDDDFNYRNQAFQNSTSSNNKQVNIKEEVKPLVKTVSWPKITFLGVIVNQKSSRKTVLIKVNNKEYMFREGDKIENVFLNKIYVDSVELFFSNDTKIFQKSK